MTGCGPSDSNFAIRAYLETVHHRCGIREVCEPDGPRGSSPNLLEHMHFSNVDPSVNTLQSTLQYYVPTGFITNYCIIFIYYTTYNKIYCLILLHLLWSHVPCWKCEYIHHIHTIRYVDDILLLFLFLMYLWPLNITSMLLLHLCIPFQAVENIYIVDIQMMFKQIMFFLCMQNNIYTNTFKSSCFFI